MGFVVMGLATAFAGFMMRRSTAACWTRPLLLPTLLTLGAIILVVLTTEVGFLQGFLNTPSFTGPQWAACLGLALVFAVAVEAEKALRRRRSAAVQRPRALVGCPAGGVRGQGEQAAQELREGRGVHPDALVALALGGRG